MNEINEQKLNNFLDSGSEYFYKQNNKFEVNYMIQPLKDVADGLKKLNDNFKKADESSTNLSESLNKLTFFGVLIAGTSIILLLIQFLFENKIWPFIQ